MKLVELENLFNLKILLPLDIQFFADGGEGDDLDDDKKQDDKDLGKDKDVDKDKKDDKKPSLEDLLADEEFSKQFQSTLDKRVTDALKKQEKKLKEDFERKQKEAQMTDEEKRQQELQKIEEERKQKEIQLKARELKLDLVEILEEEELDTSFRDLIDVSTLLHIEDKEEATEELKSKVKKIKSTFEAIVNKQVEAIKKEYLKGNPPANLDGKGNPKPVDDYEKARQKKDVKGMLSAKFSGFGTK